MVDLNNIDVLATTSLFFCRMSKMADNDRKWW